MSSELTSYIAKKRSEKMTDSEISAKLLASGWDAQLVSQALGSHDDDVPLPPSSTGSPKPTAVVQTLTTRGLEYKIMFISLVVWAIALGLLLQALVSQWLDADTFSVAATTPGTTAAIIVALPVFGILFMRLHRAEKADQGLRADPSRRRAIQAILVVAFIVGVWSLINCLTSLFNGNTRSILSAVMHLLVTLVIAGSIFAYYWRDQHRN
jgi:hypothetical protein